MDKLTSPTTIRALMERHGFGFSKKLGQNFLISENVCKRIALEGVPTPESGVIEIGAGIGSLTNELAKLASKVVSYELDEKLIPILAETLDGYGNVTVLNEDFMKSDAHAVIVKELAGMPVYVCANLPYYVTTPIIMKILEERLPVSAITVMIQKEAAHRLCAQCGTRECGAITAAIRYYTEPEILFDVSAGNFMPAPSVDSTVIRLNVRKETPLSGEDEKSFFAMIKAAFAQRRKTLSNSLSSQLPLSSSQYADIIEKTGLKRNARAEELTFEQLLELSRMISESV